MDRTGFRTPRPSDRIGRLGPRTLALVVSLAATVGVTAGELHNLGTLEDFKARFNRDAGKPRLLLLLSPTGVVPASVES